MPGATTAGFAALASGFLVTGGWLGGVALGLLIGGVVVAGALALVARSSARQKSFSALVAHEFKTPLAAIKSLSENLSDGVVQGQDLGELAAEVAQRAGAGGVVGGSVFR